MRRFTRLRTGAILTAAAMAWASQRAGAANTLNWDPAITDSATGGGPGTWNLSLVNWYNSATPGEQAWVDTNPTTPTDIAIFGGATGGAVTLGSNLSAADLVFTAAGYTFSGSDTLTLGANTNGIGIDASALTSGTTTINIPIDLVATQTWNVGGGSTVVDSGGLTGSSNISKIGSGTLTLSSNNSGYTGSTSIGNGVAGVAAGELIINNNGALGSGALIIDSGASLDSTTAGIVVGGNTVNWDGAFTFVGTQSLNLGTGAVTMGGAGASTRTVTVKSNSLEIDGALTDAGLADNLTKQGAGTLILTNASNSYTGTGGATINGGTIALNTTGVLGTTGPLTLTNGGLTYSGTSSAARSQTFGALTDNAGLDTIALTPASGQPTTFTAASVARSAAGGIEIYSGAGLGSTPGNGVATVSFSAPPTATQSTGSGTAVFADADGTGALNTFGAAVLRGAIAYNGTNYGFATYDTTNGDGVRLLNGSEQTSTYTANDNVLFNLTGPVGITGATTNTLQLNNTSGSTQTVTNTGTALQPINGLLFTGSSATTLTGGSLSFNPTVSGDLPIMSTDSATVTIASILAVSSSTIPSGYTFGGSGNIAVTGGITTTKGGGIYIDGPGTVTFSGTTMFGLSSNGLNVEGGTAVLNPSINLSTSSSLSGTRPWRVASGATLNMDGANITYTTGQTGNVIDDLADVNGAGGTIENTSGTTATLTVITTSETGGAITFSGAITNNINIVRNVGSTGTDTNSTEEQILAGANTYTGNTTITAGYLGLGANNALPTTTSPLIINGSNASVASVLDMNGFNQTVESLTGAITTGTAFVENDAATVGVSTLTVGGSANTTFAGVIRDNNGNTAWDGRTGTAVGQVGLAKQGSGTLTLTGANTYSGPTTVGGGLLQIASGGSLGASSNVTVNGGMLLANGTVGGSVTAYGGGILAGTSTGNYNGAVTVNSGGHLAPGLGTVGAPLGVLNIGSAGLTLASGSILDYHFAEGPLNSDETVVTGGLTLNATPSNPIDLNVFTSGQTSKFDPQATSGTDTFNLIQYTGTALPQGPLTDFTILNPFSVASPWSYTVEAAAPGSGPSGSNLVQLVITFPPPESWAGGTSSNWGTAASVGNNWSANQVPSSVGQAVTFPGTASRFTVDLDGSRTVGTISFTGGGTNTSYVVDQGSSPGGGSLTLNNNGNIASITNTSGVLQTISAPINLTTGLSTSISSTSGGSIALSGAITGSSTSPIVASGAGTLALTGSNGSDLGGVTVSSGTVQINSNTSLGAATATAVVDSGTLEVLNTIPSPETRPFQLGSSTSTIQIDGGATYELDGGISDVGPTFPGTLNLTGTGTLIVTGTAGTTGGIAISSTSILQLGNTAGTLGATVSNGPLVINGNGVVNVGNSGSPLPSATTVTISSNISGGTSGTTGITQNGGTLLLSGSNSAYAGNVTVNGGSLGATLDVVAGSSVTGTGIGNLNVSGIVTLTSTGTGTGTLSNNYASATTYTGPFTDLNLASSSTLDIVTTNASLTLGLQLVGDNTTSITRTSTGTGVLNLGLNTNTNWSDGPETTPVSMVGFEGTFTNQSGAIDIVNRNAGSSVGTWVFNAPDTITIESIIGSVVFGSLSGSSPIFSNEAATTTQTGARILVGNLNTNTTYYGAMTGTVGIQKVGTGSLTLSAQNQFITDSQTNLAGEPVVINNGTLSAGVSTMGTTSGPFGASNEPVLVGDVGTTGNLNTAAVATSAAVTVSNHIIISGGPAGAPTAGTLSIAGNSANSSTFSGPVTLENNVTLSQVTSGSLNVTGGITGTPNLTGPDTEAFASNNGPIDTINGNSPLNSGFQTITFAGPGNVNVSAATNATNSFGIYDSNDPNLNNESAYVGTGGGFVYNGSNGLISVSVTGGTTTFASVNSYSGGTSVSGGQLIFGNLSPALSARSVSALSISGGVVQVATAGASGGSANGARNVLVLSSGPSITQGTPTLYSTSPVTAPALTISGGTLDLTNNDLIVHSGSSGESTFGNISTAGTIENLVATGRGTNGAWTGTGITSSAAAATPSTMALAAVINDKNQSGSGSLTGALVGTTAGFNHGLSTFDGQTVVDGDVLVKYTYYGDALLNGNVTAGDYAQIDNAYNVDKTSPGTLVGWYNGDFNYDGVINGDDYSLIDNAYNSQGSVNFAGVSAGPAEMIASDTAQIAAVATPAVPEPTTLGILGIGAAGLLMRRRRRNA
jgi:autotransporter-associated beta strand protein